ncbi:MAG: ATP-binding protein [Bacillota bacterium]|nr:ATP-binding protein [Bacillota bacterium]
MSEKLILDLLITLSPILIYSVLLENKNAKYSPIMCGTLAGMAAFLCMVFTYKNYGLEWDLRYVPIILSYLYCGVFSGGIATFIVLVTRTFLSGGNLIFAYVGCFITILIPAIVSRKFYQYNHDKRIKITVLVGMWPIIIAVASLFLFDFLKGDPAHFFSFGYDLLFLGFIHFLSIWISAKLMEGLSERQKMKAEIEKAEKLNTLGELAASIAHEVRNPLTVVKGFLQLMQQAEKGKNYEYLSIVLNELGRAESIINDYLNFAKPKFEKIEEFEIVHALNEIILLLEPLALKKGVLLESDWDYNSFRLMTDQNQLKQALINLIKNAIEATDKDGRVAVKLQIHNRSAIIQIIDTGKGMTKEQLSRMGTLFYTTKEKGTGLGTSVSMRIIETMNGKVSFKSEPKVGTEVTLVFPMGK